jgi:hypothetical protein
MEQSPSWEAHSHSARQEIPAFYGTRRLISVFTRTRYWTLSWAKCIQPTNSHTMSLTTVPIFPSDLPTKILHYFLSLPGVLHTSSISSSSSIRYEALYYAIFSILTFSLLHPLFSSAACSQILSICVFVSLSVRDQVLYHYKATWNS